MQLKGKIDLSKINIEKIIKLLAYIIPITVVLFILYANFLPFGYSDHQIIKVGKDGDTSGKFYLEENFNLSSRQKLNDKYFRYLEGTTYAVYNPRVILTDAKIEATIKGEDVYFITQPDLDFEWDYEWDINNISDFEIEGPSPDSVYFQFINGERVSTLDTSKTFAMFFDWDASLSKTLAEGSLSLTQDARVMTLSFNDKEIIYEVPDYFLGNAHTSLVGFNGEDIYFFVNEEFVGKKPHTGGFRSIKIKEGTFIKPYNPEIKETIAERDGCMYFDGETRLVLPDSADRFEEGPFAIYVEWVPEKMEDRQQLIGHYNWEVFQEKDSVRFTIGRTTETNSFHSISYNIESDFLKKESTLLAIYNPSKNNTTEGYIDLFVNNTFAGRESFGNEIINPDYNKRRGLRMGNSAHGGAPWFVGSICQAKFTYKELIPKKKMTIQMNVEKDKEKIKIPIIGEGKISQVEIKIKK